MGSRFNRVALRQRLANTLIASSWLLGMTSVSAQCDTDSCDQACDPAACVEACDQMLSCDGCGVESDCDLFPGLKHLRQSFAENGISFQNNVTQFYMGNTTGGLEREFRYGGHGDYVTNVDFGKLGIQEGLFLKIRAEHRFGESVGGSTGAILPSNVAADLPVVDSEDLYLTNVLFTQAFSEQFAVFAGKLDSLNGDMNAFAHGRGIRQFSNIAFVATPIALRTVPYSTLGAGFVVLGEGQPLFTFLVLNATDTTRTSGFSELFADGCVLTAELRLPTQYFNLPGHQLFGGTWSSRDYVGLDQDPRIILPNVPIERQSGSWSLYWNSDQYLVADSKDPSKGWGYFARAGIADEATNPIGYFLSAGLGGSSPIAGRDTDSFGVGYYYAGASDDIGVVLETVFGDIGDSQGFESFYNIALNQMVTVTPDIQVIDPARTALDTALVAGVRVNLAF